MSGAEPCTGSNKEGYWRVGFRLADGATPMVPVQAGPKSERMSPKRLEATTTSKNSGCKTKRATMISIWCLSQDRKSTRLNSSHMAKSYDDLCLKKNKS